MWETFAAQFAGGFGKSLGSGLTGGGGGPTSSGVNLQGAAWQVGGGDFSAPVTVNTASPGAMGGIGGGLPSWMLAAAAVGALWLLTRKR